MYTQLTGVSLPKEDHDRYCLVSMSKIELSCDRQAGDLFHRLIMYLVHLHKCMQEEINSTDSKYSKDTASTCLEPDQA